jgi:parvulin-like peptidyl-prolyl isomerase
MDQPSKYHAIILAAITATVVAGSAGCSWFGMGKKEAAVGDTQPLASQSVYASPLKADPGRTGDYRRQGVLDSSGNIASAPVTAAPVDNRPLVLLPPTTRPIASSQYLVLGSIVANVNGTPIYAHELMKQVAPLLRARARDLDERQFRKLARDELEGQRRNLIKSELTYAAAQRNTTADEVREAQARTFYFREQLVSRAGGSLEMARQLAREQGDDFDAMLKQEERRQLVGIYYRKRIIPRVAITVDEMRRYYEQNREKQFSVPAQASIRLVRIDLKDVGSESAALDRANEVKRRADAGEPFETLAAEFNRMPLLVDSKGLIGPLSKGSYVIQAVDDAIWPTPQGKTSPVIKTKDAYYVFQVVEKQDGRTMAFEEPAVQKDIQATLGDQKQGELTKRNNEALAKDAVIQADDQMLQPVVEMAMQMYGEWRNGTAAAR